MLMEKVRNLKNQTIKLLRIESELNRRFKSSNPLKTPPLIYASGNNWESQNPNIMVKFEHSQMK